MPAVFVSPSLQEYNPYVDGGNEEYYMNLIADELIPYLIASGITVGRNSPEQTLSQAIAQSNQESYDLHLALHSNAAPPNLAGKLKGADVYYHTQSAQGKKAASIIADNYKALYPDPNNVQLIPTTSLAELNRTTYYRCYRKERLLKPKEQEYIRQLFLKRGIKEEPVYDEYVEQYEW